MLLSIASGKGGTGKTLIATNLARLWADEGRRVIYVDADVEEPNGHLFLHPVIENERDFCVQVPTLNGKSCAGHGKCQETCAFNAILSIKGNVIVFDELCHSCGACVLACPDAALEERARPIGRVSSGNAKGIDFYSGTLNVGEARGTPLISGVVDEALKRTSHDEGILIIDVPSRRSHPVEGGNVPNFAI